jgi:hypothetical protein
MSTRRRFVKRPTQFVVGVQLYLETTGFTYRKWGATQTCKPGDWLVNDDGDTYTIDRESFARTYQSTGPGMYMMVTRTRFRGRPSNGRTNRRRDPSELFAAYDTPRH